MENSQKSFIISNKKLARCPFIYEKKIMDEVVLVHRSTGKYYSLNPTGTAIWQYCEKSRNWPEILDFVSHEYQIEKIMLEEEIGNYLEELIQERILEIQ